MDTKALISAVHGRVPLWNHTNKHYHNRDITQKLWNEVAKEMLSTSEVVKKKWKGLKDVFRRELKKVAGAKSLSKPWLTISQWAYFHDMDFMREQMAPRELIGSMEPGDFVETELAGSPCELEYDHVTPIHYSIKMEPQEAQVPNNPVRCNPETEMVALAGFDGEPADRRDFRRRRRYMKRRNVSFTTRLLQIEAQKLRVLRRNHEMKTDEDYNYLLSFLPHLKQMTLKQKLMFRVKMQELLYNTMCETEGTGSLA